MNIKTKLSEIVFGQTFQIQSLAEKEQLLVAQSARHIVR
jgi:hypothetical protein